MATRRIREERIRQRRTSRMRSSLAQRELFAESSGCLSFAAMFALGIAGIMGICSHFPPFPRPEGYAIAPEEAFVHPAPQERSEMVLIANNG